VESFVRGAFDDGISRVSFEELTQPTMDPPRARTCVKPFVSPIFTTRSPPSSLPSSLASMLAFENTDAPPALAYSTDSSLSELLKRLGFAFVTEAPPEHPMPAVKAVATRKTASIFGIKGIACPELSGYLTNA
jgi:hypothetical protein